jgi:hypothetical protein
MPDVTLLGCRILRSRDCGCGAGCFAGARETMATPARTRRLREGPASRRSRSTSRAIRVSCVTPRRQASVTRIPVQNPSHSNRNRNGRLTFIPARECRERRGPSCPTPARPRAGTGRSGAGQAVSRIRRRHCPRGPAVPPSTPHTSHTHSWCTRPAPARASRAEASSSTTTSRQDAGRCRRHRSASAAVITSNGIAP